MTQYIGGKRARLIRESVARHLYGGLEALGWFDPSRRHAPIRWVTKPLDNDQPVPPNTLAFADDGSPYVIDEELGSLLAEHRREYTVDFYAENESLGLDLIEDVRDVLSGRFTSTLGQQGPVIPVYDFQQATPPVIFHCSVEDVMVDRARNWPEEWKKAWYACAFTVVDHYGDEDY